MTIIDMQKKLDAISAEVNELHPLIEVLFNKMSNIISVENTHGTSEFGADFILTKHDDILGDTEYIGIIAKIGSIKQSDVHNVIGRQIKECELKRLVQGGKKEIILSEIWILTTKNIAQNAKDLIHHEYQNKNIKFVDGDKLAKLVDTWCPDYWMDVNIKESDLLSQIKSQNKEADCNLSLIKTENRNFYIEQEILETYENEYGKNKKRKRKPIDIHHEIESNKLVLVEGGMGAGKSKLLRRIVDYYSDIEIYQDKKIIPVMVSYSEFSNQYSLSFEKLLEDRLKEYGHQELKLENVLFCIDGFDEKQNDKNHRLEDICKLWDELKEFKGWRLILTSRFINGLVEDEVKISFCRRLELTQLSLNKTIKFLEELCKEVDLSSRLIEDLKRSQLIKELPRSPISAILLAQLINENSSDLPANLTELYTKYLELMLGRWDLDKGLETQKEYQVSERIIENISIDFIDDNLTHLTYDDCFRYFEGYIEQRHYPFTARELFDKVIERSNILKVDSNMQRIYFSHRTFAEYYYAKRKMESEKLPIDGRVFNMYWMNIYFFYVGLHEDCPDLINKISQVHPESEPEEWIKIINLSNFFLAGYSSPYITVEENLHRPILMAARLFLEITKGDRPRSPFNFLPEIALLWWVQYTLRESYSYSHFSKAFETVVLKIEESEISEDQKLYALFFTSLIYSDLGTVEPLEYFLDKYRSRLPLDLKLGLFYEGRELKSVTKKFKKQIKNLRRSLNEYPKQLMDDLHHKPLQKRSV